MRIEDASGRELAVGDKVFAADLGVFKKILLHLNSVPDWETYLRQETARTAGDNSSPLTRDQVEARTTDLVDKTLFTVWSVAPLSIRVGASGDRNRVATLDPSEVRLPPESALDYLRKQYFGAPAYAWLAGAVAAVVGAVAVVKASRRPNW